MKILTYICALLLGALFISASLPSRDSQATGNLTNTKENDLSSVIPTPTVKPPDPGEDETLGEALKVRNITISLGEEIDAVIHKLGNQNRIVETEYDFDFYVYNNDYRRLLFIAVKENRVVGYYTDSEDFLFKGISSGANLSLINNTLNENYLLSEVLIYQSEEYSAKFLMDTVDTEALSGIYVLDNSLEIEEYTENVLRSIELLNFDLVNSIRARHSLPLLSWSSTAAKAARKHSMDMAVNNYFGHISPYGITPGDRLREEGQNYSRIAENIIAGYGTAIISNHAWYTSPEHRMNILNPEYTSVGIGFVYQSESHYKTYMTQEFYR